MSTTHKLTRTSHIQSGADLASFLGVCQNHFNNWSGRPDCAKLDELLSQLEFTIDTDFPIKKAEGVSLPHTPHTVNSGDIWEGAYDQAYLIFGITGDTQQLAAILIGGDTPYRGTMRYDRVTANASKNQEMQLLRRTWPR